MKRLFLLSAVLILSACSFHPIYGVNKYTPVSTETKFETIQIANIPNREGQYLRNALIDRLYRNGKTKNPEYTLTISPIRETQRDLDITIEADTTRAQLRLDTQMRLTDIKTKEDVINRNLNSIASYNVLGSEFTNRVSEQSTRENILNDLARQIEMQISLYFKQDKS